MTRVKLSRATLLLHHPHRVIVCPAVCRIDIGMCAQSPTVAFSYNRALIKPLQRQVSESIACVMRSISPCTSSFNTNGFLCSSKPVSATFCLCISEAKSTSVCCLTLLVEMECQASLRKLHSVLASDAGAIF